MSKDASHGTYLLYLNGQVVYPFFKLNFTLFNDLASL